MSTKQNIEENMVVNTDVIAKCFGITPRRVRQLTEDGTIRRVGHGRYHLIDTVNTYVKFLKLSAEVLDEDSVTESLKYEQWLHEKAKREKAEIELSHIKKEMHKSDEVEKVLNHMIMAFRSKILSLPSKLAMVLVNKNDPKLIEVLIERDVHEALKEISEYDPALFMEITEPEDEMVEVEEIENGSKKHAESVQKNS